MQLHFLQTGRTSDKCGYVCGRICYNKDIMIIGILIFILGLVFLLRNLGVISFPGSFWSLFYPLLIMGIGFVILFVTHEGRKLLKNIKKLLSGEKRE